jgi:hypothetical protein
MRLPSTLPMQIPRRILPAALLVAAILGTGCTKLAPAIAVPSPAPIAATIPGESLSPALRTNILWHSWPLPESHDPLDARFREAREALWNYDTRKATNLFRLLLEEPRPPVSRAALKQLIVQSHELDGDWASVAQAYEALGLAEERPGAVRHARLLAQRPRRSIRFSGEATSLSYELARGQLVVASIEVGGVRGRFLLDTGFSSSCLTRACAESVGAEELDSYANLEDANGRNRRAPWRLVRHLRIGPLAVENIPVVTMDRDSLPGISGRIDGVIGWDLLQHADVTFDFTKRTLVIREPSGPMNPDPNLAGRHVPAIRAMTDTGHTMDLFLDTGYSDSIGKFTLNDTDGSLEHLVDTSAIRRRWKPSFTISLNSFRMHFPRQLRPARFWFSGHSFARPAADVNRLSGTDSHEPRRFDGVIGNAPFTSGSLRLVGTRRFATYLPAEQ